MKQREPINQANAEPIALTASAAAFSVLAVVVAPELESAGLWAQGLGAAVGGVSLAAMFVGLRRALHRRWAHPLLGIWVYRTVPHDESRRADVGYGVAEISQHSNGALTYRVDLYRDPDDALQCAAHQSPDGESHGTAVGLAVEFDPESGALWILYRVQYYSDTDPDREGHLFVRASGPAGHRVLRGSWASDLMGRQLSAGTMTMMRLDDFRRFTQRANAEGAGGG